MGSEDGAGGVEHNGRAKGIESPDRVQQTEVHGGTAYQQATPRPEKWRTTVERGFKAKAGTRWSWRAAYIMT